MAKTKGQAPPKDALALFAPSIQAINVNLWSFIGLALLPAIFIGSMTAVGMVHNIPNPYQPGSPNTITITGSFVLLVGASILLTLLIAPALTYLQLQSTRGKKVGVIDALSTGFTFVWRYIGLSIIFGLLLFFGLVLLIVPGLIILRRYYLAPFFLIDRDVTITEAMTLSANASKPYSWAIWSIVLVSVLLSVFGFIPVIGALISTLLQFFYSCAPALRYEEIRHGLKH